MKNFLLVVALILSFAFDAGAPPVPNQSTTFVDTDDTTSSVICKIIGYTHGIGGPMITIVIIGAALLAIFGRMPWPALFALGAFTAVFFGAPVVVSKIVPGGVICKNGATACPDGTNWDTSTGACKK